MRKILTVLFAVVMVFTFSGCGKNVQTGERELSPQVVQVSKNTVKGLLAACQYLAPIASVVVSAYGDTDAQAAMKMASASLGTLSALVDRAATQDQTNAAFSALQVAWSGIDSAYKADPKAAEKLAAIQIAAESAKAIIIPLISDVTPVNPTQ